MRFFDTVGTSWKGNLHPRSLSFAEWVGDKQKKETSVYADLLVRWARLELAQDYSHYPLKVACLPFHHHRVFELGLQRYDKNLYFQTFLRKFSIFFHFWGEKILRSRSG